MSGIQTATVETLTAEVRVLMVGSRQITLSVAKQLDTCPFFEMQPMGRIRMADGVCLIGKRLSDGTLVTASIPYERHASNGFSAKTIGKGAVRLCLDKYGAQRKNKEVDFGVNLGGTVQMCIDGDWYSFDADAIDGCLDSYANHRANGRQCGYPLMPEVSPATLAILRSTMQQRFAAIAEPNERIHAAEVMPLIVLAGLR
jgi:hypothetical protein